MSTNPIALKTLVYEVPGADAVTVRRDLEYANGKTFDLYRSTAAPIPVVIIVSGYPDPGFQKIVGCRFKDMGSSVSWGRAIAASGLAAITYTNREPAVDLHRLLEFIRQNADELRVDENRIGIWASSGNAPLAVSVLMEANAWLKCAVLCCPYTLGQIDDIAKKFGFVPPPMGKRVADLPSDVPLFIARAGRDEMPHLNETLDRFVAEALAANLPVTIVNHPDGPHAFDLLDPGRTSQRIIREILEFLRVNP